MKVMTRALWGALVFFLMLAPVAADNEAPKATEVPILYRITYWEVSDKTLASLAGKSRLSAKGLEGRKLQSSELLAISDQDALVALLRKSPLWYYDPRANQFQLQFVDTGVKLDARCVAKGSDRFDLEVRQELSSMVKERPGVGGDGKTSYPEANTFILELTFADVKLGDTLLLGTSSGPLTVSHLKALDPQLKSAHLVVTLELETP